VKKWKSKAEGDENDDDDGGLKNKKPIISTRFKDKFSLTSG
jgi:hypothetical protein